MDLLKGFPVIITVPLHWGEQDAFGHINNAAYLRWAETARVEYLMRAGIWRRYFEDKVGPIVANISCDYRRVLTYPDTVHVGTRVTGIGNSSIRMSHRIVSVAAGDVAADMTSVLVLYDYTCGKPVTVPSEMREAIAKIEGE